MTALQNIFRLLIVIVAMGAGLIGCGGPPNLSELPARDLYDMGMQKYQDGKYLRSLELFRALVYNYPGASVIDTAQYYLAMSHYGNKDHALAAAEFNRLLINYPASDFAVRAQFLRAVCFFEGTPKHHGLDQTDLKSAIRQFEDFIIDHPESESIEEAGKFLNIAQTRLARKHYEAGIVYVRIHDYRAAKIYFQKVVDDFTNTEYAAKASFQIADADFQRNDWDKAYEGFANFKIVFPHHEWTEKASQRSCKAAMKGGEEAFKQGDYQLAQTRFNRYVLSCNSDAGDLEKANNYLNTIRELLAADTSVVEVRTDNAES